MLVEDIFMWLYMDIFGLFIFFVKGYKYILFVVDFFSKFLEVFLFKIQELKEIVDVLFFEIFICYGVLCVIVSDCG